MIVCTSMYCSMQEYEYTVSVRCSRIHLVPRCWCSGVGIDVDGRRTSNCESSADCGVLRLGGGQSVGELIVLLWFYVVEMRMSVRDS